MTQLGGGVWYHFPSPPPPSPSAFPTHMVGALSCFPFRFAPILGALVDTALMDNDPSNVPAICPWPIVCCMQSGWVTGCIACCSSNHCRRQSGKPRSIPPGGQAGVLGHVTHTGHQTHAPHGGAGQAILHAPPRGGGAGGHPFRGKGQWGNSAFGRRCGSSNAQGILGGLGTLPGGASDRPFSAMSLPMRGHFLRLPWTPPANTLQHFSLDIYLPRGGAVSLHGWVLPPPRP